MTEYAIAIRIPSRLNLTTEAVDHLSRIAADASHAARSFTRVELTGMVVLCLCQAGYGTLRTQFRTVRALIVLARKLAKVDWRKAPDQVYQASKQFVQYLPEWARGQWEKFQSLPKTEQQDEVVSLFITVMVMGLVAGGRDLEGGLPDTDIALGGIGAHRNPFSHTILLGLGMEFTIRLWLLFLGKAYTRLPKSHHPLWDRINSIFARSEDRLVAAGWAGLGAHLANDGAIWAGATKPLVGIPFHMPMSVHQLIIESNALAASLIGIGVLGYKKVSMKGAINQWIRKMPKKNDK